MLEFLPPESKSPKKISCDSISPQFLAHLSTRFKTILKKNVAYMSFFTGCALSHSQTLSEIMNSFQVTGWPIFSLHFSSISTSSDIAAHSLHLKYLHYLASDTLHLFFFFCFAFYFNSCSFLVYPIASSFSL